MDGRVAKGVSRPASRTIAMPKHRIEEVEDPLMRKIRYLDKAGGRVGEGTADGEGAATLVRPPAVTERTISGLRVSRPM